MLWDKGTYSPDKREPDEDPEIAVRDGLRKGDLKITFHGERLHGSFALVRMKLAIAPQGSRNGFSSSTATTTHRSRMS
jgi:hypothetical protein